MIFGEGKLNDSKCLRLLTHSLSHRRTSLQLDLLSRADLGEALSLISRMIRVDEID
jgi:hypothetical protein